MKQLNELLKAIEPIYVIGPHEVEVQDITIDSRAVKAGSLFIAVKGTQADGHAYIPQAIEKGASVVVCQKLPTQLPAGV